MKTHHVKKIILFSILLGLSQVSWAACTQTLSPGANLASAISSAAAGSTICLNSGSYGSLALSSIIKTSDVTLQSVSGVTASLSSLNMTNSNRIKLQNLTIGGCDISGGSTKNITLSGNTFTSQCRINTLDMVNANILVDGNIFDAINANGGPEGRLQINQYPSQSQVVGVTATNNHFGKFGCTDGIQIGAYGVVIGPGNVFEDNAQGSCVEHIDSIQLYGQSHTTINGNYFVRVNVCIGAYSGGDTEIVKNNVFIASGGTNNCVLDFGSISNLNFSHNTVVGANPRIGGINSPTATTGVISNNIMLNGAFNTNSGNGCTPCTFDRNLFNVSSSAKGSNTIIGNPTFVGGTGPSTLAGYQLTSSSLGYHAATDGNDLGTNFFLGTGTTSTLTQLLAPSNLRVN